MLILMMKALTNVAHGWIILLTLTLLMTKDPEGQVLLQVLQVLALTLKIICGDVTDTQVYY